MFGPFSEFVAICFLGFRAWNLEFRLLEPEHMIRPLTNRDS